MAFLTEDKRKRRRIKRAYEKARIKLNKKVYAKVKELMQNKELLEKIDKEIAESPDIKEYIQSAEKYAKGDLNNAK